MALKRMKGTREITGATHTSCKVWPLVLLLLDKALGPQGPGARPLENSTFDLRWRPQGDKCQDIPPGVTSGKSATGFRFALHRGLAC